MSNFEKRVRAEHALIKKMRELNYSGKLNSPVKFESIIDILRPFIRKVIELSIQNKNN